MTLQQVSILQDIQSQVRMLRVESAGSPRHVGILKGIDEQLNGLLTNSLAQEELDFGELRTMASGGEPLVNSAPPPVVDNPPAPPPVSIKAD